MLRLKRSKNQRERKLFIFLYPYPFPEDGWSEGGVGSTSFGYQKLFDPSIMIHWFLYWLRLNSSSSLQYIIAVLSVTINSSLCRNHSADRALGSFLGLIFELSFNLLTTVILFTLAKWSELTSLREKNGHVIASILKGDVSMPGIAFRPSVSMSLVCFEADGVLRTEEGDDS